MGEKVQAKQRWNGTSATNLMRTKPGTANLGPPELLECPDALSSATTRAVKVYIREYLSHRATRAYKTSAKETLHSTHGY